MLSILSWNIRQGGGSRVLAICKALISQNPTVIQLSEYRNQSAGQTIRTQLLNAGYRYQAVTHAASEQNSTAIFSKIPFDSIIYDHLDDEYNANLITARFPVFDLTGVYLPHKKKHRLFDTLIELSESETPQIIVGDYNSGINGIDQKGQSFWYEDQLKTMAKKGMVDAFRQLHGDVREYSWYSHQGNGYRYDHTYTSESLIPIIKSCDYLHAWREEKLSDHSPMLLTLA